MYLADRFLAFNFYTQWANATDDDKVARFADDILRKLDQRSKAADLYYPFTYLNDASTGETVFQYYGGGKSLPRMREIRRRYDPEGIFQTLQPGGFKIGW